MDYKPGNAVIAIFAVAWLFVSIITTHPITFVFVQEMVVKDIIQQKYHTNGEMFSKSFIKDEITPLAISMYLPCNVFEFIKTFRSQQLTTKQAIIFEMINKRLSDEFDRLLGDESNMCVAGGCRL